MHISAAQAPKLFVLYYGIESHEFNYSPCFNQLGKLPEVKVSAGHYRHGAWHFGLISVILKQSEWTSNLISQNSRTHKKKGRERKSEVLPLNFCCWTQNSFWKWPEVCLLSNGTSEVASWNPCKVPTQGQWREGEQGFYLPLYFFSSCTSLFSFLWNHCFLSMRYRGE